MCDFFLSYATSDDKPAIHGVEGSRWVTAFFETLKNRVGFHLGRPAQPFLDRSELEGNAPLTNQITNALDNTRLFVAVSTPTYYKRPWCEKERSHFIASLGVEPAAARRVFVVHQTCLDSKNPLSWQSYFFPDVRGYYFHRQKLQTEGGGFATFGFPLVTPENASEYGSAVDALARDMAKRIMELEQAPHPPQAGATGGQAAVGVRETVLLAPCSFRMSQEFEELRRTLDGEGFEVVVPGTAAAATPDGIRGSLGFVQIVGPALFEIPGDPSGNTLDKEIWRAATAAGLPMFRWRSPDVDVDAAGKNHPGHEDFLRVAVREQLFATFKKDLVDELALLREKRRIASRANGNRVVLLVADRADLVSAARLEPVLRGAGLGTWIAESPDADVLADDMCALLVYYGQASPEAVRRHLSIVRTLPSPRRRNLPVGVYFEQPPPNRASKHLFFSLPDFHLVDWNDGPAFQRFIGSIHAS